LPAGFLNQAIVGFSHERSGEAPRGFVVLKRGAGADECKLREFARAKRANK
jgi:hypothetical protein